MVAHLLHLVHWALTIALYNLLPLRREFISIQVQYCFLIVPRTMNNSTITPCTNPYVISYQSPYQPGLPAAVIVSMACGITAILVPFGVAVLQYWFRGHHRGLILHSADRFLTNKVGKVDSSYATTVIDGKALALNSSSVLVWRQGFIHDTKRWKVLRRALTVTWAMDALSTGVFF